MFVTLLGMVTLVKPLQRENAEVPMPTTGMPFMVDGIVTVVAPLEQLYPVIVIAPELTL